MLASISVFAQKTYSTKTGQISFDASATVDIKAVNNQVDSKFIDNTGQMIFSLLIKSFKFANGLMEDHFNEDYMESTKFPKADFKGYISNVASVNFAKNGTYPVNADGTPVKDNLVGTIIEKVNTLFTSFKEVQVLLKVLSKEYDKQQKIIEKAQKKRQNAKNSPSGFAKPNKISDELCDFIGVPHGTEKSRTDITRFINTYVKEIDKCIAILGNQA